MQNKYNHNNDKNPTHKESISSAVFQDTRYRQTHTEVCMYNTFRADADSQGLGPHDQHIKWLFITLFTQNQHTI